MKSTIVDAWLRIRASYWFLPSLIVVGALIAAVFAVRLDVFLGQTQPRRLDWLFANHADAAQAQQVEHIRAEVRDSDMPAALRRKLELN